MSPAPPDGPTVMQTTNLAELYDLPPLDWEPVRARLDAGVPQAPGAGGPARFTFD
jgi:hypothetical protein